MSIYKLPENKKSKVLLVVDHMFFHLSIKETLVENGFEVRSAYDGIEGIEILLNEPNFNAVLSNLSFGIMDDSSFLSAASILSPDIITILIGESGIPECETSSEINLILKKPFQKAQWLQAIKHSIAC